MVISAPLNDHISKLIFISAFINDNIKKLIITEKNVIKTMVSLFGYAKSNMVIERSRNDHINTFF